MAKINLNTLKHLERDEEIDIINYVEEHHNQGQIEILGFSGTGKTEIIKSSISIMHRGDFFDKYAIIHFDASQLAENCTDELFYNLLIYKLLQKSEPNEINQTYVSKKDAFLSFLEKSSYKEEVKNNAKRTLVTSLSLLPTVGPLIYKLLNVTEDNTMLKEYQTNAYIFSEYLNYLSLENGLLIFIDNIQYLSDKIVFDFYEIIRQLEGNVILFTSYTLKDKEKITKKLLEKYKLNSENEIFEIKNISLSLFEKICKDNLSSKIYYDLSEQLDYFYELVQYGNMREIDELIFQINQNGLESINDTPTLQGIKALDEIKKDIIDLTSMFPEGIKLSFIEQIVKYNHGCTEAQLKQSISNLCKMRYILIGDNDTLKIEHEKITKASKENLEFDAEEDRFVELIHSCTKVFTEIAYETIDDSDFVFCVKGLIGIEKQLNLIKHLGILEKYVNILYINYKFLQICQLYRNLSQSTSYGSNISGLFPINSIIQILDAFQKTSNFSEGLEISNYLSSFYNMDLYKSKFLLQSYHYQEAIDTIKPHLNNYESWSIYLNALQHLRKDDEVRQNVRKLIMHNIQYSDIEYYYIILRNSGHLFDFNDAIDNINQSLEYFIKIDNKFVESTCRNNIGILYLYHGDEPQNIHIARKYFLQAKKIMEQLRSNEEYQSNINIGVSYFCEGNYDLALEYFECAQKIVPDSLSFDRIKLECNILICKYIKSECSVDDTRKELLSLISKAEELPDPWIKLLCTYNLLVLRNGTISEWSKSLQDYPGEINVYGLILKNKNLHNFMLGISPHWRY